MALHANEESIAELSKSGAGVGQSIYIGQQYDAGTQLSYLNARYYEGSRGQFLSEDPSFLAIGDPNQVQQNTGQSQQSYLADPQQLNAYSYGRDNPITNKDPNGKIAIADDVAILGIGALVLGGIALYNYENVMLRNGGRIPQVNIPSPPQGVEDILKNINPNNLDPWKKWALITGVVGATAAEIYNDFKDKLASIPSIFIGGSNSGNNGTRITAPNPNPTISNPQPTNNGQSSRSTTPTNNSSGGFSSSFLQGIQQQINAIQAQINQIQSQINALSGRK